MSQKLLEELSEATKQVNQVIIKMFSDRLEPKELYDASKHLIEAGGKRVRPFLVLESCELVGGRREDALPAAVAVEFIHTFTMIHDDIMDRDDKRRGVSTVHASWGVPIAITAGDMLFAKAYEAVLTTMKSSRIYPRRILKILDIITKETIAICEGQVLDVMFERRDVVSEEEYFDMIGKKTASLLEMPAKIGAIAGGGKASQVNRLGQFAHHSGLAFQVVDDILGLTSDEKVLGKPVGSDVREGKKTLIMIHALTHATETQRKNIYSVLGNEEASNQEIEETVRIIRSLGSIDYASKIAEKLVEKAKRQLSPFSPSQAKENLLNLADYIVTREY